jgi:hypothetical protein
MAAGGTLRMVFEADAWDSTISFAPGIPVTLGGTLELTFADNVNLASQLGRTLKIFDGTGVTPTGTFAVNSPYRWDTSNLYTTGQITLTAIPERTTFILAAMALGTCIARRPRALAPHRSAVRSARHYATSTSSNSSPSAAATACRLDSLTSFPCSMSRMVA